MATYVTYGPWAPSSGASKRMRIRITWVMSDPRPGDTTVSVSVQIALEAGYRFWDNSAQYARSGTFGSRSENRPVRVDVTGGYTVLESFSDTFPLRPQGYDISCAASLSGVDYIGGGVRAFHESTLWIPAHGSARPNTPSPGAYRITDRAIRVEWPAVPLATHYRIERWVESDKAWTRIGTIYGTSYVDYGVWENDQFRYRVDAWNGALDSSWGESNYIRTTPSQPSLNISRIGGNIRVELRHNARYPQRWQLERRVNGGEWRSWLSGGDGAAVGEMTPQPGETWQFRGRTGTGVGAELWSTWAVSEDVPALVPPAAPTLLAPIGTISSEEQAVLTWRHEPIDRTPQQQAEIQYRAATAPADAWQTATVTGSVQELRVPLTVGDWVWRARTRGLHADPGPWSPLAGFTVALPPTVTIDSPQDGQTVEASRLTVTYTATDPGGAAILGYDATLTDSGESRQVAAWQDRSHPGRIEAPARLEDGHDYVYAMRVQSGTGLWSQWVRVSIHVDYADPAVPTISARWVEEEGYVVVTAEAGSDAAAPATVELRVEVSRDDDATWQPLDTITSTSGTVIDPRPYLNQSVGYRVRAVSALPSETLSDTVRVGTPTRRLWLEGDDGTRAHLILDMELAETHGHELVLAEYEGDTYPTPHFGTARSDQSTFSGLLTPRHGSPADVWLRLLGQRIWYRTPTGVLWRAVLAASGIPLKHHRGQSRAVGVTGTAVRISE